jgi:hypothetical protein
MFIVRNTSRQGNKVYHSVLLRESYREDKKVKKRTLLNLSKWDEKAISALEFALKNKELMPTLIGTEFTSHQGRSIGSAYVLHAVAKKLGIVDALGSSFHAQLALWLIFSRIIAQGSRLSATRLDSQYDFASVIGLERGFDENNLYDALHWLSDNQRSIEDALFKIKDKTQNYYWYDVTSSYFEGIHNEYAAFGYNRDKKKGKRIVVIGLLCQDNGDPISIEAFNGNTQDTQTFENQLIKLKERFGCESVTLICDRGIIKDKQKKLLCEYGFHYITALPMPQVKALIEKEEIKLSDFTDKMKEINTNGCRHVYRRNPERALETNNNRENRFQTVQEKINGFNLYLKQHPKASIASVQKKIDKILVKYCLSEWVTVSHQGKEFTLHRDEERRAELAKLDGCYVWTTDLPESKLSTRDIYDRYKDLKYVEDDFRSFKTNFLEIRPIFVRNKKSTEGHLLVTMLSHLILRELRTAWLQFNMTAEEALDELSLICQNVMELPDGTRINYIPVPNENMRKLLTAANVTIPKSIDEVKVPVVTRTKIRQATTR